jgi:hypothetical protein
LLDTTVRLRIRTRERRYIVEDDVALEAALRGKGSPIEYQVGQSETEITTIYFDTAEGTWSKSLSPMKMRARSYNDPAHWWLELKRRQNERVDKWRRPLPAEAILENVAGVNRWKRLTRHIGAEPLVPIFGVRVRRTAFEWLSLRVTLDRDLTFFRVDPTVPLQLGERIGHVEGLVAEVKCEEDLPEWLAPALEGRLAPIYSKSRYALALLAGESRPHLVAARQVDPVTAG